MKLQVLETMKKYQLISHGETLVLAVSGGIDSMVMMDLFVGFAEDFDLTLIVAHMDHAKRSDSNLDAELVEQIAKKWQLAFEETTLPQMNETGNFQAYARRSRYEFFKEVVIKHKANKIVTAHHANDHLETFIDRMLKVDVPAGLIGIRPFAHVADVSIIRPLIEIEKQELYAYAEKFNVAFREDMSNASDDYLRNRIRRHVVPQLMNERRDVLSHARQLSDHLQADEAYFEDQVDKLMAMVKKSETGYELSLSWLQNLPISLYRRLLIRLIPALSKGAFSELKAFLNNGAASGICHVGGENVVKKSYDKVLVMTSNGIDLKEDFQIELAVNRENKLPDGQKMFLKQGEILENRKENFESRRFDEKSEKNKAQATYLCYNNIRMPLMVRNRKVGDRIQLTNGHHASVKKIMIDAKVPIDERENWPIVVDANEQIVWIPKLKTSPVCLNKPNSSKDLWLEIYE